VFAAVGVPGVQADLAVVAVEAGPDGGLGLAAIKIIDEQGLYLPGHRNASFCALLWRASVDHQRR